MEENTLEDELFSMDDIRIEVMRARGAGGQVCHICVIYIWEKLCVLNFIARK